MAKKRATKTATGRSAAARKGWATRRAAVAKSGQPGPREAARNALLGYERPASPALIPSRDPEADIRSLDLALFQPPKKGKKRRYPSEEITQALIERLNTIVPGRIVRKDAWRVSIRLPRKASTATLADLLTPFTEGLGLDDIELKGGRIHLGLTTIEGEYLPLGGGFGEANDALVEGVTSMINDVMKYRSRKSEKG